MTMELNEAGLVKAERRVGRLMRMNGIKPVRTRRHKITTDCNRRLRVPTNWLDGHFCRCYTRPKVERRCFLFLDCGGLALPCRYTRSAQSQRCRLSSQRPYEERPRDKGTGYSGRLRQPPEGAYSTQIVATSIAPMNIKRNGRPKAWALASRNIVARLGRLTAASWGTPIPIIHRQAYGAVPVADHRLPVKLPAPFYAQPQC